MKQITLDQIKPSENSLRYAAEILRRERSKFDANETMALAKQMEFIRAKEIQTLYEKTRAFEFVDVATDVPPGALTYNILEFDEVGEAEVVANAADDIPLVDANVKENPAPIHTLAVGFTWSVTQLMNAAFAKIPLQDRKTSIARVALQRKIDHIASYGIAQAGTQGLLNNKNVPTAEANVDFFAGSVDTIAAKVGESILRVQEQSGEHFETSHAVFPLAHYGALATRKMSQYSPETILEWLQRTHKDVTFAAWDKLKTADGGEPRALIYAKDPNVVDFVLPDEFMMLEPEKRNLAYITACISRVGGTNWMQPLGGLYLNGIGTR